MLDKFCARYDFDIKNFDSAWVLVLETQKNYIVLYLVKLKIVNKINLSKLLL